MQHTVQPVLDLPRSSIARMQADLEGMDWGSLVAPAVAARTTQLYDRRSDRVSLDEIEKIKI